MVVPSQKKQKKLYETDYHLWVLETVKNLQNKEFEAIDWENLIEEVSDLGRRDRKKLKSLLKKLIEHLLKLKYWQAEKSRNQGHWQAEITNFRQLIQDELEDSPSLQPYLHEIYPQCYTEARKIASQRSQLPLNTFPEEPIAPLEQILDENWLP
ncbi:DUF29 domain-containing protein [Euhalothece natronophila Z-M001]|uniref:DUF29 domain-containing protein n=1 Tax=Euhalothece natronophila Z-M001 TaxID=522448 RepID=A0A5B8NIJ3_9CHRO|nr:DUF29 domain-containing protein [Euhalothece natronophila]QDZ39002.1 DUF29 domain-containing protein [Euhalothece natronophila Z-M001]